VLIVSNLCFNLCVQDEVSTMADPVNHFNGRGTPFQPLWPDNHGSVFQDLLMKKGIYGTS